MGQGRGTALWDAWRPSGTPLPGGKAGAPRSALSKPPLAQQPCGLGPQPSASLPYAGMERQPLSRGNRALCN